MASLSQIRIGETLPVFGGDSGTRRYPMDAKGRLRIGAHLLKVRLLDLSAQGAKLQVEDGSVLDLIATGALVLLNMVCLPMPKLAVVARQDGDKIGLRFSEPLDLAQVQGLDRPIG